MSSQSQRVRQLFGDALERPAADRDAFLAACCGDDVALRQQVERLLADHRDLAAALPESQPAGELEGEHIGPYRLLERIGEGGFGTVWMAEQQQPIRRKVALKIVKWGMDTRQVVARFEAERQALALMEHPHIARVFDGGATATGRPYFAMELVRGVPITKYCDEAKLTLRQRIELFVPVCEAVQHAHQKGVVHRDLKPSNVLVTLHDGKPVPKVIDFGIAKATAGQLTDKTLFTGFRQMLGTPEYMAPEQVEMSGLDIDTRADIYSLGVLLYELLTGTKPFELKEVIAAGWQELVRRIKEVDPDKPSTRVSTLGERLTAIATQRRTLPKALSSACRGDVDCIVQKALEKERSRRYETAHAFAEDLARHLRDEPVLASPPGRWYRWRKYVRRHRLGVAAGKAVAGSLLAGAALAGWGYWRAEAEAAKAVRSAGLAEANAKEAQAAREEERVQAERSRRVVRLLRGMLVSADPKRQKGPEYRVRELLADFEREIDASLPCQPAVEAELRSVVGSSYLGLGLMENAERHLVRALELRRALHGDRHPDVAASLYDMVVLRTAQRRLQDGLRASEQAFAALAPDQADGDELRSMLLGAQGAIFCGLGDYQRVIETGERAVVLATTACPGDTRQVRDLRQLLAESLLQAGFPAEAEVAIRDSLGTEPGPGDCDGLVVLAQTLDNLGRGQEADQVSAMALATAKKYFGLEHEQVASALTTRASVLQGEDLDEAEGLARQALEIVAKCGLQQHSRARHGKRVLAEILCERGKLDEAESLAHDSLALGQRIGGPAQLEAGQLALGKILLRRGDHAAAEALFTGVCAAMQRRLGETHPSVTEVLVTLARCAQQAGDLQRAEALLRQSLDRTWHSARARAGAQVRLAGILANRNQLAEAEQLLRAALPVAEVTREWPQFVAVIQGELASVLHRRGDLEQAASLVQQALATRQALCNGGSDASVPRLLVHMADIRLAQGDRGAAAKFAEQTADWLHQHAGEEALVPADDAWRLPDCRAALGRILRELDRYEEAEPHLRRALEHFRRDPSRQGLAASVAGQLGKALMQRKQWSQAEPLLRETVDFFRDRDAAQLAVEQSWLGNLFLRQDRFAEAEPILRENVEQWRGQVGTSSVQYASSLLNLALAYRGLGRFADAIGLHQQAIAIVRQAAGDQQTTLADHLARLARCQLEAGLSADAEAPARESLAIRERRVAGSKAHHRAMCMLGRVLVAQGRREEGEPLLVRGCTGLLAAGVDEHVRKAVAALVEIYGHLRRPEEAAKWQAKLEAAARSGAPQSK
jgi:serine/threonine protein kinase/tetratricopeptide (TPR) repeat protein